MQIIASFQTTLASLPSALTQPPARNPLQPPPTFAQRRGNNQSCLSSCMDTTDDSRGDQVYSISASYASYIRRSIIFPNYAQVSLN